MGSHIGKQTVLFDKPVYISGYASVVGKKEGEGPLGPMFDKIVDDPMFGMNNWEEAESKLQQETIDILFDKCGIKPEDVQYIFAGDLLGQLIATSFGIMKYNIPLFGLYGACSTMGESMALASMIVSGGFADNALAMASSHFASAEKQFRFPLEYGNQRPLAATWTVTGCGAVMIGEKKTGIRITGITTGKVMDYGVKDSMNMGACMAPAACNVISSNFEDTGFRKDYYDSIITGDLGYVGRKILLELLKEKAIDIEGIYSDCGIEIFDSSAQDTDSGGSGCGCSASVLCSYIIHKMKKGVWKRVLFIPTGALLSTVSYNEGKSIPAIAHGIMLEKV